MFGQHRSIRKLCSLVLLCSLFGLILAACGNNSGNFNNISVNGSTPSAQTPTSTPAQATVPLTVTSIDMAVSPSSLSGIACGTNLTVTYTATFHFPANNAGAEVHFQYTTNNGRGSTPAGLIVSPGQTTIAYNFTWTGQLPADHTQPGLGGVIVTSPNSLNSQLVGPTGTCSVPQSGSFVVTGIELSASPSLTGHACGTHFTETYTAIFHIKPNGPGGDIVFGYSTTNGRGGTDNSNTLHVNAGQTSVTYQFTWSGTLPADHTAPGVGIVLMSAPNTGESPAAVPSGMCS